MAKKRAQKIKDERAVRVDYLSRHPFCEGHRDGAPGVCFGELHIHEPWPRARGGPTNDNRNMRAVDDHLNTQISQDADTMEWAYANNYLVRTADGPQWLSQQRYR